jgi:hypothetical protein
MKAMLKAVLAATAALGLSAPLGAEESPPPNPAATPSPLAQLAWMDGQWRGKAWVLTRSGRIDLIQTERSGSMLGGAVRLVEGSGYDAAGTRRFNALGVIAARSDGSLEMHSWAQGQAGVFPIEVTDTGYSWSIPAGPATIRYVARLEGGRWIETGHRLVAGQEPMPIYAMELERIGTSSWPAADAVPPR